LISNGTLADRSVVSATLPSERRLNARRGFADTRPHMPTQVGGAQIYPAPFHQPTSMAVSELWPGLIRCEEGAIFGIGTNAIVPAL